MGSCLFKTSWGSGEGVSLQGCLVLHCVSTSPYSYCEVEPFELLLQLTGNYFGLSVFSPLKGQVHVADSTDSLKVKGCSYLDSIFDFLSIQSGVLKLSFLIA